MHLELKYLPRLPRKLDFDIGCVGAGFIGTIKTNRPSAWAFAWLALLLLSGCGNRSGPVHGPFGPAVSSRLLAPFQGAWRLDADKTLEARKAAGANNDEIARLRKMHEGRQRLHLGAALTIVDNEALGSPFPSSEYRFFHLHRHGDKVCGKAWHHEDRFDPGDVSKCYVQLEIVEECLHFRSCVIEGLPNPNDPELISPLPVEMDLAEKCAAEEGKAWTEWMVFVRVATK
jgi:hypothetical protein